jgi:hypothetical protein
LSGGRGKCDPAAVTPSCSNEWDCRLRYGKQKSHY